MLISKRALSLMALIGVYVYSDKASAIESQKGSQRDFSLQLPVVAFGGEAAAKLEWNLFNQGSISAMIQVIGRNETLRPEEKKLYPKDSMRTYGQELGLIYTRYSNPRTLSGGYWALGVGQRNVKVVWNRSPREDFALSRGAYELSDDGMAKHVLKGGGVAVHTRVGYRYVGESIPLSIGTFIGLRHYESQLKDHSGAGVAMTLSKEKKSLSRQFRTGLEPGLEFGFAL